MDISTYPGTDRHDRDKKHTQRIRNERFYTLTGERGAGGQGEKQRKNGVRRVRDARAAHISPSAIIGLAIMIMIIIIIMYKKNSKIPSSLIASRHHRSTRSASTYSAAVVVVERPPLPPPTRFSFPSRASSSTGISYPDYGVTRIKRINDYT